MADSCPQLSGQGPPWISTAGGRDDFRSASFWGRADRMSAVPATWPVDDGRLTMAVFRRVS